MSYFHFFIIERQLVWSVWMNNPNLSLMAIFFNLPCASFFLNLPSSFFLMGHLQVFFNWPSASFFLQIGHLQVFLVAICECELRQLKVQRLDPALSSQLNSWPILWKVSTLTTLDKYVWYSSRFVPSICFALLFVHLSGFGLSVGLMFKFPMCDGWSEFFIPCECMWIDSWVCIPTWNSTDIVAIRFHKKFYI